MTFGLGGQGMPAWRLKIQKSTKIDFSQIQLNGLQFCILEHLETLGPNIDLRDICHFNF